jgi:aryl-alcohol dehydrogenase-like predicted oxidoreductase
VNRPELKKLGASGVFVPTMGIGTMSRGVKGTGYGKSFTFNDILQTYQTCLDNGLNFFDTAPVYGRGESERLLGECYKKDGRPIVISTKFAPNSLLLPSLKRLSPQSLFGELDNSLQRLGVDCIDIYQLHTPPARNKLDSYIDVLAEAVHRGKIKSVGLCNFTESLMRQAHKRLAHYGLPLASMMVGYNILRRYPENNGVLQACRELDVSLLAYAPLAEGVLTGKYRAGAKSLPIVARLLFYIEQLDFYKEREKAPLLRRLFSRPRNLKLKKMEPIFMVLEEIANDHDRTIAQVAINWIMTTDPKVIPVVGAKRVRQAQENIGALNWTLTKDEYSRISQAEIATR